MTTDIVENGRGAVENGQGGGTIDDEAYAPTYAEAFPPLPNPGEGEAIPEEEGVSNAAPAWGAKHRNLALRSRVVTQVFSVPLEERRFKELSAEQQFGERPGRNQAKICVDIMSKTGVAIEMSLSRDQSLSFVITGKPDSVLQARKLVVQNLQTQASIQLKIPKDHHRYILGVKGKKLADLELQTATKISVPRSDNSSDEITITGTKEGIDKARHEILLISDEQAKLAFIRMPIPKIYHPFILGPNGQTLKEIVDSTGARVNVPPPAVMKDEIVVSGEKEGALRAEQAINSIYNSKKHVKAVAVEVKKSQHKYIIGPKGINLAEILAETGVAVEVPALDSASETITLRGDADKLGLALTAVYAKANSVIVQDVPVPGWLHRFIIGPKGASIREINQQFPKIHIEFSDEQDKVTIEGPPEEVERAMAALVAKRDDLLSRMAFVDLKIDPKYHRHIIGKSGANIARIKEETGVSIKIPDEQSNSNIVRIEGSPEGVARAKFDLIEMIEKFDNEKSRDILIDHRFHKAIIGAGGNNIREIRDKFSQVNISFPDPTKQSDVVTLRGPKQDVDDCYKHLHTLAQDMAASNYKADVHIFKEVHRNIIGKGGAKIKQIRDETETKIELPREDSDSDVITITGKKENVEKAKNMIEAIQKELANIKEITIEIPHDYHTSLIGSKGRLIRAVMEECGGVIIRFPGESTKSNKVVIRGPKDDVEKAKTQLLEMADQKKEASYTEEVRTKPEFHGFLIGRKGSSIKEIREQTGARVIFPASADPDQELITIVGTKEAVQKAKKDLEAKIKNLENVVEDELEVDMKHHRHFTARRGEVLTQISSECGGVVISFPRQSAASSRVTLKGAKDCIEAAKKRIREIVTDIENQVTIEYSVPARMHGSIMGPKGQRIQDITREHNVLVKFPDRRTSEENGEGEGEGEVVNGGGGENGLTSKNPDLILITGLRDNCEAAKIAMQALLPITEEVEIAYEFHGQIIGQKGKDVQELMDKYKVNISIPPSPQQLNSVKVTGVPANVEAAKQALRERVAALEEDKKQRELRSYKLEVEVPAKYHTRIIGRRGVEVTKLRTKFEVQIHFPGKESEDSDTIVITGLQEQAEACRDELLSRVKEFEDMITEEVSIDPRVHSRIIGSKGRGVSRLMTEFKVDIRFPGQDSEDNSIILITGPEENVLDCKDHLLNLEEEYLQDVTEGPDSYRPSARPTAADYFAGLPTPQQPAAAGSAAPARGFVVRDAPWSLSSTEEFPDLGSAAASAPSSKPSWPVRR